MLGIQYFGPEDRRNTEDGRTRCEAAVPANDDARVAPDDRAAGSSTTLPAAEARTRASSLRTSTTLEDDRFVASFTDLNTGSRLAFEVKGDRYLDEDGKPIRARDHRQGALPPACSRSSRA